MKKRKIAIIATASLLALGLGTFALAEYYFTRSITDQKVELGGFELNKKDFLSYATYNGDNLITQSNYSAADYSHSSNTSPANYLQALKSRQQTAKEIDASVENNITCYATEKGGYSSEDNTCFYLNQLGLQYGFTTSIPVYFRIHIEDSWISTKVYNNGNINTTAVIKDTLDTGASPFAPNDTENWVYDATSNYAYYKSVVQPSDEMISGSYDIASNYFYSVAPGKAYREEIKVQISYDVEIVQANRASKVWKVDLKSILG